MNTFPFVILPELPVTVERKGERVRVSELKGAVLKVSSRPDFVASPRKGVKWLKNSTMVTEEAV